jgi:OMF family outer membrane factor
LPSLSAYGVYGTTGFGYNESPNDFLKFFPIGFVGVQMSVPLFNGTVTKRKINQKKIELQNGELRINLITEQNAMLVENTMSQRIVAQQTVINTLSQIQLALSIYDQTVLQQKQGIATLTDVLLADNVLREAQQAYLSAVVDYLKADLDLKKLTGNINTIKN